ncbi:MAG: hypothetical protein AAGB15_12840, partial [Pseudomonadota bacterium]
MRRGAALGWVLSATLLTAGQASAETAVSVSTADQPAAQPAISAAQAPALAAPVLSAEALALRTALEAKLGRNSTALTAYAASGYKPVWLNADGTASPRARALTAILSKAGNHALPEAKYKGAALTARLTETGPRLEADLTAAFLAYASDVSSGLLEPRKIDRELIIERRRLDHGLLIRTAYGAADMIGYLEGLAPQDPAYARLVERYIAFRSVAGGDIWGPAVNRGKTLRPGNRGNRVAQVRARLTAMGDLDPNVYDVQQAGIVADGTQLAVADSQTDVPRQA